MLFLTRRQEHGEMNTSMEHHQPFGGDKKVGASLSYDIEQRFVRWATPRVPKWIETYHLTLATIPISACIILFSYLARSHISWLWGASFMIFLQWVTDTLDGSIGRARGTGLIKWGYYMDHFLDYIFLCSILIGYSLLLPDAYKYLLFFLLVIFGSFIVNAYLKFAATNEFRISFFRIGPTEIRLVFIVVNTLLIVFGKTYMAWSLPYVLVFSLFGLTLVVYRTQKEIWEADMEKKRREQNPESHGEPAEERRSI